MQVRPTGWKAREWESLPKEGLGGPCLSWEGSGGKGREERKEGGIKIWLFSRSERTLYASAWQRQKTLEKRMMSRKKDGARVLV